VNATLRALALGLALALCLSTQTAGAARPSLDPQVRVAQDMHTAPIGQIRADAAFSRLFTVSSDKTLRIWRLADLQLLRAVYLPSEVGVEGLPSSVAVSADGKFAYVAGATGWAWNQSTHIYLIDVERGRITGTVGRFDNDVVESMELSPDGKRLAVGLARGGVRIVDAASGSVLQADAAYAGPVTYLNFSLDGRLASTSRDGCVRVYGTDLTLVLRRQYPPTPPGQAQCSGSDLGGIRFSPDGRLLAFGVRYRFEGGKYLPEVLVLDGHSLATRRVVRASDPDQQSLCCIAWSPDSGTLYVRGNVEGDAPMPIYRVRDPLTGPVERWSFGRQQISNMLPLPDGQMVFTTTVPSIVKVGANGEVVSGPGNKPTVALPGNVDFYRYRADAMAFRVSADGRKVAFATGDGSRLVADLGTDKLQQALGTGGSNDPGLFGVNRAGAVKVDTALGVYAYRKPTLVNGIPPPLETEESVWSWATHGELPIAALGTQWRVRLVDAQGKALPGWETPPFLPAPAYHIVITRDGKWVVAALGDGTMRWYAVATGKEVLGFFTHANGSDWVAWRADGYYASSPNGDQYVGWLVNRSGRESPDFFRAAQFERQLYRPDLVRAALRDPSTVGRASDQLAQTLRQLAAPRVAIESIVPGVEPGTLAVRFTAEATGRRINEVGVYVDGVPVLRAAERVVAGEEGQRLTRTVIAPASSSRAEVRVEAETDASLGIDESAPLAPSLAASPRQGKLWLLAVGVHRFDKLPDVRPLPSTTNDARELRAAFASQQGRAFSELRATVLTEQAADKPTKANVMAQLGELKQVQPEDTVVVFLASHGIADAAEYYFLPKDATPGDVDKVLAAQSKGTRLVDGAVPSMLTGTELMQALRRIPGRRILMLDTCHADAAGRGSDPYALLKRSASTQVAVVSAARGDELSHDTPDAKHGAFTLAIIEALNGKAQPAKGPMTLRAAFDAATPRLQETLKVLQTKTRSVAERAGIRQTPVLTAQPALEASVLAVH
jgi:WD40 repeat protein